MSVALRYVALVAWLLLPGCDNALPADVTGYATSCTRMNALPIPRRSADPHPGHKNVYACNIQVSDLEHGTRPFTDGTIIVKESIKENVDYPWLIATARKVHGQWQWDEYTRNFADEEFLHTLGLESICTECHSQVRSADWIFTRYQTR